MLRFHVFKDEVTTLRTICTAGQYVHDALEMKTATLAVVCTRGTYAYAKTVSGILLVYRSVWRHFGHADV